MTTKTVSFEQLVYQVVDGAARIRLSRPEVLNSFTTQLRTAWPGFQC